MHNSTTTVEADIAIRKLRDSLLEDRVLNLAINMIAEMADFLCDVRQLGLA